VNQNFLTRTLTGAIFVIVLISAIELHPIVFCILFGAITTLGLHEFYMLSSSNGLHPGKYQGIAGGILIYSIICLLAAGIINKSAILILIPIFSALFIFEIYRNKEFPFQNIANLILGWVYIAIPFSILVWVGFPVNDAYTYHPHMILGFFILIWASDTGAYLVGISMGKHLLFPRISPKKTWEGWVGGSIFTLFIAGIISKFFTDVQLIDWVIIAGIISIFGIWGDLAESMLKRSYQVKDSGNILPGHGGILDRFDSALFSVPIVFIYLQAKYLLFH